MSMPADLVLIRHGESEGNVAVHASRSGDDSHMTERFLATHSSRWRLSPKGVEQAKITGEWARENLPRFDRFYVSEYARALETAALLELPGAEWRIDPLVRERWWGDLDRMPEAERQQLFERSLRDADTTPYYWTPPSGESLVEVVARLRLFLGTLHRECAGQAVVVVCHGEVMEAFRILLERMNEHDYLIWDEAKRSDETLKIRNCQVWHYSRRAPGEQVLDHSVNWVRSALAWDGYEGPWQRIERQTYSDAELLEIAGASPHLLEIG